MVYKPLLHSAVEQPAAGGVTLRADQAILVVISLSPTHLKQ
jgi:hypothetical protein